MVTTNAGHLLWSRVADAGQAARMARRFLEPDMFSGWGIRTLSAAHPAYNPMSYHDGSVWPHDNGIVALGLSLYEHKEAVLPVFTALADAANGMEYHRLPELFCGMERAHGRRPVLYPVSCSPQAWASGAFFMLLQAITGLFPDAPARMLHIREPLLPPFLQQLIVHGLRIGQSRVARRSRATRSPGAPRLPYGVRQRRRRGAPRRPAAHHAMFASSVGANSCTLSFSSRPESPAPFRCSAAIDRGMRSCQRSPSARVCSGSATDAPTRAGPARKTHQH